MIQSLTLIYDRKKRASAKKCGTVELVISLCGKRKYLSTGVKVLPKEWKNGGVTARDDQNELNEQLHLLKKKVNGIIARMQEEGKVDLDAIPGIMRDEMLLTKTFLGYAKEMAQERYKHVSERTRKHYEVFLRFAEEWRGIVYFSDVNERNVMKMDAVLKSRGLKEVSRWGYHKILKTFILMAIGDGLVKKNPYSRLNIGKGESNSLDKVLTAEEFHRFERCIIPIAHLRRVRDLFVFQAYTMMGYSDLADFDYEKCKKEKGMVVYKARRNKTGQPFTVLIMKPAMAILKRYDYKLPIISNVKYNDYLKAAVTYAKIDKPVTTHWARHTGATMLLNEGRLPMHVIQHILGHSSIRETEKTYARMMDETIIEQMANYQKRLG
jgi:integrase